jgi:hypothetical protein
MKRMTFFAWPNVGMAARESDARRLNTVLFMSELIAPYESEDNLNEYPVTKNSRAFSALRS